MPYDELNQLQAVLAENERRREIRAAIDATQAAATAPQTILVATVEDVRRLRLNRGGDGNG